MGSHFFGGGLKRRAGLFSFSRRQRMSMRLRTIGKSVKPKRDRERDREYRDRERERGPETYRIDSPPVPPPYESEMQ